MNYPYSDTPGSVPSDVDTTLRLVASLPAPEGLEDRIHLKLRNTPRSGHILEWTTPLRSTGHWMRSTAMRSAAAAAIVFVVAGGGWGIYTRVQPNKVIVMPARVASPGFSGAKAMRTPDPFTAPRVVAAPGSDSARPALSAQEQSTPEQSTADQHKKPGKVVPMTAHAAAQTQGNPGTRPATPAAASPAR